MTFSEYLETQSIPEWRKAYIDYKGLCAALAAIEKHSRPVNEDVLHRPASSIVESPILPSSSHHTHHSSILSEVVSRELDETFQQERVELSDNAQESGNLVTLYNIVSHATKQERIFFYKLDEQLDRISRFYNEREHELKSKLTALKIQMDLVADYGQLLSEEQETSRQHDTEYGHSKLNPLYWLPQHHRSAIMAKAPVANLSHLPIPLRYAKNDNLSYQVARGRLKKALAQFYRNLEYLKSYKEVNFLGFQSILKKYDRITQWQASKMYMEKVKQCHWVSSKDLETITEETVRLFSNEFAEGNRTRGERCLKRTEKEQASLTATSWRVGFYFGAATFLLLYDISLALDPETARRVPYIHTHLQIYACFSVPILFVLGVSLNMMVWVRCRVNYKFIFELDPRDNLDYHQFAEIPCFMLLLLGATMFVDFTQCLDPWVTSEICPMVLFIVLLSILFCPFNILYLSARKWLCRTLSRIVFGYFFPVEFRDFFIADELNSLSYSFWTLNYFLCAYAYDWRDLDKDNHCHVTHMWITPVLAALAPWWRFVQCIRRYQDSSEKVHLVNAAKYSSTILATFATGLRRIYPSSSTDMIWILASMINSSYTSIWDIKMDWGLLQTPSRHFLLRDDLIYYKWVYYVAAPVNVILRFAWALNTASLTLHSDVLGYITALLEAYRRLQWNLFRLENEHFNNCADYRAINEIPLPFATTVAPDEEHAKPHDQEIRLPSSDEEEAEPTHHQPQHESAVDVTGSKLPRRLKHQRLQRQHTWAHTINEATPPKIKLKRQGTFYGRRDFDSKREGKADDASTTSSSTVNAHDEDDEDDEDLLHEHR